MKITCCDEQILEIHSQGAPALLIRGDSVYIGPVPLVEDGAVFPPSAHAVAECVAGAGILVADMTGPIIGDGVALSAGRHTFVLTCKKCKSVLIDVQPKEETAHV